MRQQYPNGGYLILVDSKAGKKENAVGYLTQDDKKIEGNALHQRGRRCGAGRYHAGLRRGELLPHERPGRKGRRNAQEGRVHGGTQQVVRGVRLPGSAC